MSHTEYGLLDQAQPNATVQKLVQMQVVPWLQR
jgi:hypothetical protein